MSAPEEPVDERPWLERLGELPPPPRPWLVPVLTLAAGAVCAVVAGLEVGAPGVVAGLAAAVVVLAFFASRAVPLAMVEALRAPRGLGLVLLLTHYAVRVLLALFVLLVLVAVGAADRAAVGLSVVVCSVVRANAQALASAGLRRPGRPSG